MELTLQQADLVAQHHDLDVLVRLGPPRGSEQAEDPAQAEVTEGEGHGRSWSLVANTASSGQRSRFWCPPAPKDRQQKQQEGKYRHEQRRGDLRRLQDLWREPLEEPEEPVVETPTQHQHRIGSDRIGSDRIGSDRIGSDRKVDYPEDL
jgi:hypothetical protein